MSYLEQLRAENPTTTRPDALLAWVKREFNPLHVDRVFQDLLDVATGTREGNRFEREAVNFVFGCNL